MAHGISLSIGTVEPLNRHYLQQTRQFMERHGITVFSEHLAFQRMDERDLTIFLSMPFEEMSIQWLKANYYAIRAALGRPFALENVTYDFSDFKISTFRSGIPSAAHRRDGLHTAS